MPNDLGDNSHISFLFCFFFSLFLLLLFFMLATSLLLSSRCCGDDAQHVPEITTQSKTVAGARYAVFLLL